MASIQQRTGRHASGGGKLLWIVLAAVVVAGIIGVAVARTASNTVPTSKSGEGAAAISGYDVSSVHYTLNATDPTKISAVSFNLDTAPPAGSSLKVRLVSGGANWYVCTNTGVAVTCATTAPPVTTQEANELTVVAAQ